MQGRIVHRRCVSRKLVFIDLLANKETPGNVRVELVVKDTAGDNTTGDTNLVRCARSVVHIGDVVQATCKFDSAPTDTLLLLRCSSLSVVSYWADENPGKPAVSLPLSGLSRRDIGALPTLPEFGALATETSSTSCSQDNDEDGDAASPEPVPHCKYWLNSGRCPRIDCKFRHVEGAQLTELRSKFVKERVQRRAFESHDPCDPIPVGGHVSRHQRAERFVEWITQQFGLKEGDAVLDVAGGRGDISFNLAFNKVASTLIDPRPRALTPQQESMLEKAAVSLPPQLCMLFDDDLIASPTHASILEKASLVIGMHPDQATEPIVDYCLSVGKPFAVLPCCVFPTQFPDRRLPDGSPVVAYSQFVDYLQAKHPGISRGFLPFRGRNLVLYWKPADVGNV